MVNQTIIRPVSKSSAKFELKLVIGYRKLAKITYFFASLINGKELTKLMQRYSFGSWRELVLHPKTIDEKSLKRKGKG